MRTSYNIYCLKTFIGFCIINNYGDTIQASLLLFDTKHIAKPGHSPDINKLVANSFPNNIIAKPGHSPDINKSYPLETNDIDIIRDLMIIAIPEIKTDSSNYTANAYGETYKI